ncbi:MAG: hypothetical protein ACOVOQ_04660 [Flavobacterium sp.]
MKKRIKVKIKSKVFIVSGRGIDLLCRDRKLKYPRTVLSDSCIVRVTGKSIIYSGEEFVQIRPYRCKKNVVWKEGWLQKTFLKDFS